VDLVREGQEVKLLLDEMPYRRLTENETEDGPRHS